MTPFDDISFVIFVCIESYLLQLVIDIPSMTIKRRESFLLASNKSMWFLNSNIISRDFSFDIGNCSRNHEGA